MTFKELQIGQRFQFKEWTLDWLSSMGDQIKTGETACMDIETHKIDEMCGPDTEVIS